MSESLIMIIVWAIIIAAALIVEFLTYDLVSVFFAPAALVGIIMATWTPWWAQVIVVVVLSVVMVLLARPFLKKFLIKPTVQTNITDVNIGKRLRLTSDSVDGVATVELNGVTWTARIMEGEELREGAMVEITSAQSNAFCVKPVVFTSQQG